MKFSKICAEGCGSMKNICVYASASTQLEPRYYQVGEEMGILLAEAGYHLVFGGGTVGLMGACARGFHQRGRRVISVIPEYLKLPGVYYEESDEVYVTEDLRKRKRIMEELSEGFVILPGGFGTLEELMEIVTLKQLGQHHKPIVVVNCFGFYDKLMEIFHQLIAERFTDARFLELCAFVKDPAEAVSYLAGYQHKETISKWGKQDEKKED